MSGRPPPRSLPGPFSRNQEIELRIETLTNEGAGLGRVDDWVVMVPFALPGERVRVRVWRNRRNYSEADLVEVLEPCPDRVEPVCPLFGRCGGCQYQHLSYAAQLDWKRRQVAELLQHFAGIEFPVQPVIPSSVAYGYRSKLTPHFNRPRGGTLGAIGFLQAGRRFELVDVPQCPIAMASINEALEALRAAVRLDPPSWPRGATLLLRAHAGGVATDPNTPVVERVGSLEFEFLAGDFFQNNPFLLPRFVAEVVERACAPLGEGTAGPRFLVDAYCGSGLFALAGAARFERVVGVEVSVTAVERARANAARNGLSNVRFLAGQAERVFDGLGFGGESACVVVDPPRKGCEPGFLAQLTELAPSRVVYVSCNPATQMRDLRILGAAGYRLRDVQPVDLFPQTRHLECIVVLERTETGL